MISVNDDRRRARRYKRELRGLWELELFERGSMCSEGKKGGQCRTVMSYREVFRERIIRKAAHPVPRITTRCFPLLESVRSDGSDAVVAARALVRAHSAGVALHAPTRKCFA